MTRRNISFFISPFNLRRVIYTYIYIFGGGGGGGVEQQCMDRETAKGIWPCLAIQTFLYTSTEFVFCVQPLKDNKFVIPKSRYDTIDCFLASGEYNDAEVVYDLQVFQQLKDGGTYNVSCDLISYLVTWWFISSHVALGGFLGRQVWMICWLSILHTCLSEIQFLCSVRNLSKMLRQIQTILM